MKFAGRYFWISVLAIIGVALVWPQPGALVKGAVAPLLMLMMALSCLKISPKHFTKLFRHPVRYLAVAGLVFIVPTVVVYGLKFLVSPAVMIGLLVTAAMPAGISAVFLADMMGGEPDKALFATTATHLVSPIITPLLIWIFTRQFIQIDFVAMSWMIVKFILIPFAAAQIIRLTPLFKPLARLSVPANMLLLLIIIWGVVGPARASILGAGVNIWRPLVVASTIMLVETVVAIWFGRTFREDITWSVVDTYKNYVLASVIVSSFFEPAALVGVVAYSVVVNLAIAPINWWATRPTALWH